MSYFLIVFTRHITGDNLLYLNFLEKRREITDDTRVQIFEFVETATLHFINFLQQEKVNITAYTDT